MIFYPNAKINIGLNVVEKRPDGYHNLETIFYPFPLTDALEVVKYKESNTPYSFTNTGITVDAKATDNICIKALQLIKERYSVAPIQIHLHKMIPFGSGLGGGSADGAFMLKLINREFNLNIADSELEEMAAKLGADCPVFINNVPAYATGIGEILEPVSLDLSGYHLAIVKPDIHVSTPEAFRGIKPKASVQNLKELIQQPVEEWKHHIKNDFEQSVFAQYPEIGNLKTKLYDSGAVYASMSGSGSSVFGLFKSAPKIVFDKSHFVWSKEL